LIDGSTRSMRRVSLAALDTAREREILLCGIGTGLDIPHLPHGAEYVGLDITPAMLARARARVRPGSPSVRLTLGDVTRLPYADAVFDAIVMHLIVAVVPRPDFALHEAARVLRSGGRILVLDKFLRPGQRAPLRRMVSPLLGRIATRTDVVLEELLAGVPGLRVVRDTPLLARGWFRSIVIEKDRGAR
jgi:ubiquinone/menaquinone biosynthesis C-methylase UbiE